MTSASSSVSRGAHEAEKWDVECRCRFRFGGIPFPGSFGHLSECAGTLVFHGFLGQVFKFFGLSKLEWQKTGN